MRKTKKKQKYICGKCGQVGHNARSHGSKSKLLAAKARAQANAHA